MTTPERDPSPDRTSEFAARTLGNEAVSASRPTEGLTADFGAHDLDAIDGPLREGPGTLIGPYRLVSLLGEGGFGSVFLAEQEIPVRRTVAIKVIKLGMDTRQVVTRFEQERQALALMDHPNIARVLDAGATETGRPYFVMELVKGEPIVAFADRMQLNVRQRVELLGQVCAAVQHAHTKGVIHRDIKPSNVLVSLEDGQPFAKVIDFGIAKATSTKLTDRTFVTEAKQLIGTPEYMSPEQATGSADIDTRTDIYSLGVLLYELLTGTTPFSGKQLRSAAFGELQRIIREVDPPIPSTRVVRSAESVADVAARRQTDPRTLGATIRGELDWIVMKALEKDRTRRYESASAMALDIRRHLAGEAIEAAPPSRAYRLRKFARRYRGPVIAAGAVAAALLVGAVGFAWQASIARGQRDRAIIAENESSKRADELQAVAEFQASMLSRFDASEAGTRLLGDIRSRFAAALEKAGISPDERATQTEAFGGAIARVNGTDTAAEMIASMILAPAAETIENRFAAQPLVAATLRSSLGELYFALGLNEPALALHERALEQRRRELGERHRDTLTSLDAVGRTLDALGRAADAEVALRKAYEVRREAFGPLDADTLASMGNLGNIYRVQGRFDEAEPLLVASLEAHRASLGNEARDTLIAANVLGYLYIMRGNAAKTEPLWREAYETGRRVFGDADPDVIVWTNNFAGLLQSEGKLPEAESLLRDALTRYRQLRGEHHPASISVLNTLGQNLAAQGRYAEAVPVTREALESARVLHGPEHPSTLLCLSSLGSHLLQLGKLDEAEACMREGYAVRRRAYGPERIETINATEALARLLATRGVNDESESLYREGLASARRSLGVEHPQTLVLMVNFGNALIQMNRLEESEAILREAVEVRTRVSGADHPETLVALSNLGMLFERQGKLAESSSTQRDVIERLVRTVGPDYPAAVNAKVALGSVLRKERRLEEAESLLREGMAGLERSLGPKHSRVAGARFLLGQTLTDAGRFAEAESALLASAEILLEAPQVTIGRKRDCLDAIVTLYERWNAAEPGKGYDATRDRWRVKREALG